MVPGGPEVSAVTATGVGALPAVVVAWVAILGAPAALLARARLGDPDRTVWTALRGGALAGGLGLLAGAVVAAAVGGLPAGVTVLTLGVAAVPLLWVVPLLVGWLLAGLLGGGAGRSRWRAALAGLAVALVVAVLAGAALTGPGGGGRLAVGTATLPTAAGWTAVVLLGPGIVAAVLLRLEGRAGDRRPPP